MELFVKMELSFLYFLYKISKDGEKMIELGDVIPIYIMTIMGNDILHHQESSIESVVNKLIYLLKTYRDSGFISLQDSKKIPFTKMRIETYNEEMMELIEQFEKSETYVQEICKAVQKKNVINRQYIEEVFQQFQKMSMEMEQNDDQNMKEVKEYVAEEEETESEEEDEIVKVKSSNGKEIYEVNVSRWTCSCPSFQYSRYQEPTCKHVWKVYHERNPESIMNTNA